MKFKGVFQDLRTESAVIRGGHMRRNGAVIIVPEVIFFCRNFSKNVAIILAIFKEQAQCVSLN